MPRTDTMSSGTEPEWFQSPTTAASLGGHRRPHSRNDFTIAIVCAVVTESNAVEAIFDEVWDNDDTIFYGKAPADSNSYMFGRIGRHNVVLVYMSGMGSLAAANAAAGLMMSFPKIQLGLVVGICGSVPFYNNGAGSTAPVFLGDIIVSTSVVQYDFGRRYGDNFVRKNTLEDSLGRPSLVVRNFIAQLKGRRVRSKISANMVKFVEEVCRQSDFAMWKRPSSDKDVLYPSSFRHKHQHPVRCAVCENCKGPADETCEKAKELSCEAIGCETWTRHEVPRRIRSEVEADSNDYPKTNFHYGPIASGNSVMKSAMHRDQIAQAERVIGFEMEGAGLWDSLPTIVIKGVCDYADSHKDKRWQKYAAVAAAAYTKSMLYEWQSPDADPSAASSMVMNKSNNGFLPTEMANVSFNNHGPVQMQAAQQTINGSLYFGPVSHQTRNSNETSYTPQTRFDFGNAQNNDYRRQQTWD